VGVLVVMLVWLAVAALVIVAITLLLRSVAAPLLDVADGVL